MKRIALALMTFAIGVAGCGGDDGDASSEPRVPGPTDTIVVYERTGGIAGTKERLDVRPDGATRASIGGYKPKSTRFRLNPTELNALRDARDAVDFASLKRSYGAEQPVADGFLTKLTADGRTVEVLTLGKPPAELQHLIDLCAGIVEAHHPR